MDEKNKDYLGSGKYYQSYEQNKIRVGSHFQATIPPLRSTSDDFMERVSEDQLLWQPSRISANSVSNFLNAIKSSPSRKINEERVLYLLHQCEYDTEEAFRRFQLLPEPAHDAEIWSEEECKNFEKVLQCHGKKFNYVQRLSPAKSVKDVVEFYYLWKRSERYDAFISDKCIYGQSRYKKKAKRKVNRAVDPADTILDEEQLANENKRLMYPIFSLLEVM